LEYSIAKAAFPILVLGIIYLTGILVGKVFCGWACPVGMVQDFLSYLPFKKQKPAPSMHATIKDWKYVLVGIALVVAVLIGFRRSSAPNSLPAGIFSDLPFGVISPSSTIFAFFPWLVLWQSTPLSQLGWAFFLKMACFFAFLGPALYIPRFFCRYFCPLGTMLDPVQRYKSLVIARSSKSNKEDTNALLSVICPMGVQVDTNSNFIDHVGCVHCGKCVAADPKRLYQDWRPIRS